MRVSDRVFGLVAIFVAFAYIASALQIETSFLSDPVGSKTFPLMIGGIAALCGLYMVIRPDDEPDWPDLTTLGLLVIAVVVLVGYAYALKPLGFLVPTAVTAAILSYQITPRPVQAVLAGLSLSVVLFVIFKYAFKLGLKPWPDGVFG